MILRIVLEFGLEKHLDLQKKLILNIKIIQKKVKNNNNSSNKSHNNNNNSQLKVNNLHKEANKIKPKVVVDKIKNSN